MTHPPQPCVVHRLPPAPSFVGRDAELQALRAFWRAGGRGVVALVGLGGAGKTALAARWLEELGDASGMPAPDGLFVWSFYQRPDPGLFLQEAYQYFVGEDAPPPGKGAGLLDMLYEALAKGRRYLIVLDGLERVQRQAGDEATYGQMEDPLLKSFLARIAQGLGSVVALITSRFPVSDLEPYHNRGYRSITVGGLEIPAARALLRRRGVQGDDADLDRLIENYGAHALTLDHLGGLIGQFLHGDPRRAPELPALANPAGDRQALRLARLLRAYEEHLPPAELALLSQLCLVRRSVTEQQIQQLFLCSPAVHVRTAREIGDAIARLPRSDEKPDQEFFLSDLGRAVQEAMEEAICAAPLAGPDTFFRLELVSKAVMLAERYEKSSESNFEELVRLYAGKELEAPTEERPLPADDRKELRTSYAWFLELRHHPLMPYQETPAALEAAFQQKGYGKKTAAKQWSGEASVAGILKTFRTVQSRLRHVSFKHALLGRVRELCRLAQRKWSLAGPLALLNGGELHAVLTALVHRHLVLAESDGTFSVHPAVRDHFARRAAASEPGAWHDILRERLVSLVLRPGVRLVDEPAGLDLVEEAIYHAREAGRADVAIDLYRNLLGGVHHLGWKLGEMSRGLRILRSFDPCPEAWDLAWYLRALGELDAAYATRPLPFFRADVRLLQGQLPLVALERDDGRTVIAEFLMGRTQKLPPDLLGYSIPRAQLLLYLGRLEDARRAACLGDVYEDFGWESERARSHLFLADIARRQSDPASARKHLGLASRWIRHSGSVEHLCLLHLTQARLLHEEGDHQAALQTAEEGLHTARQCGLALYHIELLCEVGRIRVAQGDAVAAEPALRDAWQRSGSPECQFAWGCAEAGHVLGQALLGLQRKTEARAILKEALALRQKIGHPGSKETRRVLETLS